MAKLPEPPSASALSKIPPDLYTLRANSRFFRIYPRAGEYPIAPADFRHFGPVPDARFDHHPLPAARNDEGILYGAKDALTCFAEVFQRKRFINRFSKSPWLAALETTQDLQLLNLTGLWPTRAGSSQALATSPNRVRTQAWARAIYGAYQGLHGIYYRSSMHGDGICIALFERCAGALADRTVFDRSLGDPVMLDPIMSITYQIGYGFN